MFKMDHRLSPWCLQNLITLIRNDAFCEPKEKGKSAQHEVIIKTSSWKLWSPYFIYPCCVIFMHDWQELQLAQSANCQLNGCNGRWHLLWCWWEMESKMTVMTGNWVSCEPVGKCGLNGWHIKCVRGVHVRHCDPVMVTASHALEFSTHLEPIITCFVSLSINMLNPDWLPLSSLPLYEHSLSHSHLCTSVSSRCVNTPLASEPDERLTCCAETY